MPLLERNLDALRPLTPATADLIAAAPLPAGFEPCNGTDGTPTFRRLIASSPPRIEWLGHTSMPAASAEPLVESLDPAAGNGLGLSIGTGFEWKAFAAKLPQAQAALVYEPDASLLRMALSICDLSALLNAGKIVLFTGDAIAASQQLADFLQHYPGYEVPTVLHPLPTLTGDKRNQLIAAGESMVRRAVAERQSLINALAARLDHSFRTPPTDRIAITLTPRYADERPLRRHLAGIAEICIDHHAATSIAARIDGLATHRPATILSDLFRPQIGCVPPAVSVETWIPPVVGAAFWDRIPPSPLAPNDRVIVHSAYHQSRLISLGIPAGQIEFRPAVPQAILTMPEQPLSLRHRVALIGDLSTIDAAALKIELPTHLAVFSAAHDIIAEEFLAVHPANASDILRRALSRANVTSGPDGASDPALRDPMLRIIRDVLIPTLPLHIAVQRLAGENIPLQLIGDWPGITPSELIQIDPFPSWTSDSDPAAPTLSDAALLLHLSPSGVIPPTLWQAVAAGLSIVAPQHPTDATPGALPTLLKANAEFAHPAPAQWLPTLKSLLRDSDRRNKLASAARARFSGSPTPV